MDFQLHKTQKPVALDKHRFKVLCCGRRWGKTTLAIDIMKARASIKGARIAYVAPTYQQARDIAWEQLKADCQNAVNNINEGRLELSWVNGSRIVLRGWESIETLRGQQFDLVVIDEVAMMRNFKLSWQEVIRPTLTDTKGEALFISTPKGFNHFYELYGLEASDDDYKSFHYTTYDNPYIPVEEIEKAKKELTEDRFAQEYMADFRKSEGLVYKEFSRVAHLYKEIHPKAEIIKIIGGHDFGTNNPCASITIKKDQDARYWVSEEWYIQGKTDSQQADYVSALKWDACYPDPHSTSGILEMKQRGVNVRDVIKGADSIKNGINTVKELFLTNRLKIHESCVNLIWELETYSYPVKKPDRNEEENPIKENDHALDALRYALMMDNQLTVRKVKPIIHKPPREHKNVGL